MTMITDDTVTDGMATDVRVGAWVAALRSAGFPVQWISYDPAEPPLYVAWHDDQDYPDGLDYPELWVDLSSVARGDDTAGQTSTVDRSNYRSLQRDYPETEWLDRSYANVDTLGILARDLTEDLTEILTGLAEQYCLYDESDLSELESEEITESYGQYVRYDLRALLPESVQDRWDDLTSEQDAELFWSTVSDLEIYPEHSGLEVIWSDRDLKAIAEEITSRLECAS